MNRSKFHIKIQTFAFTFIVISLLFNARTHAEDIKLFLPHFKAQSYDWNIFQGETSLTIDSGVIDSQGWATLIMPEAHKNYRGMTRWLLKTGGGLDMIYVGKGFSVECLSDKPGPGNIIYIDNPENDFLAAQHQRQKAILEKLGAVNRFLQVYTPGEALYQKVSEEQKALRRRFAQVQADRAKNPLYAARFGEIVDFTKGIADKIYENLNNHTTYFNNFVTYTLKFEDLYTSGHWDQVWHHWLMMNIRYGELKDRLDIVLKRMEQDNILKAFAQKTVPLLAQMGKDDLLPQIKDYLDKHPGAKVGLSSTVKRMLASFKILTGTKAPNLAFRAPVRTKTGVVNSDVILETENLDSDYTVLLFYQSDCQSCEDALISLSNQYRSLKNRNVRVIAISADETKQSFEKKLPYHQWPDNYCDFSGMDGTNFENYAVLGIPTLYLLDRKGIILKKTALVEDLLRAMDTRKLLKN